MKLKTIAVEGKQQEVYGPLVGAHYVYSEGSKRIILAYLIFPRTLQGERKRGFQFVEQEASIELATTSDTAVHYNRWSSERFVDPSFLEKELNELTVKK